MNSLSTQERSSRTQNQVLASLFDEVVPIHLTPVAGKAVHVNFEGGSLSSDAGLLILRQIDEQLGLTKALANSLTDERDARYTRHSTRDLMGQTVFQIAAGYEDGNDSTFLRDDPILKMMVDRCPISGNALASQPTHSRFQNAPSRTDLYRMALVLARQFIASYDTPPSGIILDFDDTDTPLYGEQQQRLFNAYYGEYCYMPLHIYEGISGRLIATILKPARLKGAILAAIVRRVVEFVRAHWPDTTIIYRGDSHFTVPEVMRYLDTDPKAMYVSGLAANSVLKDRIKDVLAETRRRFMRGNGSTVTRFHSIRYKATSWECHRRVVVKIEVSSLGANVRYVVTDMEGVRAKGLYQEIYCDRGRAENFIKDHKRYLHSDRASCHSFQANQFRLLLHSAAYVLYENLRRRMLKGTELANATIETLRLRLIKLGARVRELKTRIKIEYPTSCPVQFILRAVLTAAPGTVP